jgi:hypothetical protein
MPRVPARHLASFIRCCPVILDSVLSCRDSVTELYIPIACFYSGDDWWSSDFVSFSSLVTDAHFGRNWFPYFSILSVLLTVNQLPAILETLIFVTLVPKEGP